MMAFLLKQLSKYHRQEFEIHRTRIWMFGGFEVLSFSSAFSGAYIWAYIAYYVINFEPDWTYYLHIGLLI